MSPDALTELLGGASPLLVICGCGLLCVIGIILLFVLQLVDLVFDTLSIFVDLFGGIFGGGFEGCCGCIVLIFAMFGCGGAILLVLNLLQTCGTENAVNLCRLF